MSHPIESLPWPAPGPTHGWTPERRVRFLDRLAVHGNARAACRAVGLSAEAAYRLRRRDALFARAWAAAVVLGRENCCQVLAERAVEGVEEEIYHRGEVVGTRRRYDSRLLLAHLARLDRLADEVNAGADAAQFEELIADIAEGSRGAQPMDRDALVESAARSAEQTVRAQWAEAYAQVCTEAGEPVDTIKWDDEALEMLEEECAEAARTARTETGQKWDRRREATLRSLDTLFGEPGTVPPDATRPAHCPGARRRSGPSAEFFPWTMSTGSTFALSTATMRQPSPAWSPTPRSPFSAPRGSMKS